jgi:DNA-binding transcriptional LysR family regulator
VAPLGFGRRYVAPTAAQFRILYPNVTVSLLLFDRPAQLADDAWDLMLYSGHIMCQRILVVI